MLTKELLILLLLAKMETNALSTTAILKRDANPFQNSFPKIALLKLQDAKEMLFALNIWESDVSKFQQEHANPRFIMNAILQLGKSETRICH
jgi:hypothetical protein